jgi:hypothetical protein
MNSNEEELKVTLKKAVDKGNMPNPLYKYRSFNQRSLQILKKGEIWFSSPLKFNDPFDW